MPSNAEARPQATCKATTKAGAPCRKQAVADGLCTFHSGKLDLAELGRRGGQARGKKKAEQAGGKLDELALSALEEMLRSSTGSATARAAAARLVLDRSPSASEDLIRRTIYAEQQAAREAELPAARAKLERLIESRASELATEMYEERKALDLAAVKAELADIRPPRGPR